MIGAFRITSYNVCYTKLLRAAVSGANVITKILHMDKSLSELELEIQVELEAENAIPFPLDEVSLDFEVLGESRSDAATNNVLLSAARAESVQARATVLNDAGRNNFV